MTSLIDDAWDALVLHGNTSSPEDLSDAAGKLVPSSMEFPDAGPAIPAGEALISALKSAAEPSSQALMEVIGLTHTTFEFSVYLRRYGTGELGTLISGADLHERMRTVGKEPELQQLKEFIENTIHRLNAREDPLAIRNSMR